MLTGVTVSSTSIWNWVQVAGELAMQDIQQKIEALSEGQIPESTVEGFAPTLLVIGADGVMLPFRPNAGSPSGKTVCREVKLGIIACFQKGVNSTGKQACRPVYRQVVAVLGKIDDLKPRIWIAGVACGILQADPSQVVWLSDGGVGFWRLFREVFYCIPLHYLIFTMLLKGKRLNPSLMGEQKRLVIIFVKHGACS